MLLLLRHVTVYSGALRHGIMGRRFPDEGVAEIQKMSPSTTGYVIVVTNSNWSHEISADQSPSKNCISRLSVVIRAWL